MIKKQYIIFIYVIYSGNLKCTLTKADPTSGPPTYATHTTPHTWLWYFGLFFDSIQSDIYL